MGVHMWIHRITGTLILAVTLGFAIRAWQKIGTILDNLHSYFVFPVLFLVFFVAMGGVASRSILRRSKWNTALALRFKHGHRLAGYFLILMALGGIMAGIYFYRVNPKHPSDFPLEWVHGVTFVFVVVIVEFLYRHYNKHEIPLNSYAMKDLPEIAPSEFDQRVAKGEKLVILDSVVLNVGPFLDDHPGGRFSLENNIGRDVSKFFHGGYALENLKKVQPHVHSNDARRVVLKLVVGRLAQSSDKMLGSISGVERDASRNGHTKTLRFNRPLHDGAHFTHTCPLIDISQIGRHYLVKTTSHPLNIPCTVPGSFDQNVAGIKRHYTEAFCMRNDVYLNLLNLGSDDDQKVP
jgi:cytochrome b involved in lipid metabolism